MLDLGLAIGHHLIIFALFGILAAELVLVRRGISLDVITRLARVDIWYGVLAAAIVVVGFSRAIFAAKGWAYYSHNAFFWAKIGTFVLVALLSVPPTIQYIKWQRAGETPDQCRFVKFFPGPLFDRGPAHAVPAGPARGSAMVERRPG